MTDKLCVFCKHFNFDMGSSGYGYIPGTNPDVGCMKSYWLMDNDRDDSSGGLDEFRENIHKAETCDDYKEVMT